jgi:solute carrier family 25 phosphate transporter 3
MPIAFPSSTVLCGAFGASSPYAQFQKKAQPPANSSRLARPELWTAWSAAEDAKQKVSKLSDAAVREFEKTSAKAQAKVGGIELFSAKYYASCTFGGLMACVRTLLNHIISRIN